MSDKIVEDELLEYVKENREFINKPVMQSLLYDLNLLPEVVATFDSIEMFRKMYLIIEHFKVILKEKDET